MDRPTYPHASVRSVQSLCRALGTPETYLRALVQRIPALYTGPKPQPKKNGGVRYVFDTKPPLKPVLKKINSIFFRRIHFPKYLTGSRSGSDFVANVAIHTGSLTAIAEDIAQFFDCISDTHVRQIWREFFGFSDEVSEILTLLTTKDGHVFQGTPTSSYLANLVFWDFEPTLVEKLEGRGIRYSRYVDDITISSTHNLSDADKQWAIAQIYAMIGRGGFKPQRKKHKTHFAQRPITIMGLNANSRKFPTLTSSERSRIRAQVFQLEKQLSTGDCGPDFHVALNKASGKVGRLRRLHKNESIALRCRLNAIRLALASLPHKTSCTKPASGLEAKLSDTPPL